jgi:molybdopterin molybdotransferase
LFPERATLVSPFEHRGDRLTCHPARWAPDTPGALEPLPWRGSADLRTVAAADGFAVFEAGDRRYAAGEAVRFLPMP